MEPHPHPPPPRPPGPPPGPLHYVEMGRGEPVLLLHPTPVDSRFWLPVARSLAPRWRLILPDLRGHGASPLGSRPLSVASMAADVLDLLSRLGLERAAMVGCSIGGYLLLEMWRQRPRAFRAAAFVCSKPQPDGEADRARRRLILAEVEAGHTAAVLDRMARTLVGASAQRRRPEIVSELRAQMTLTPAALAAVQRCLMERPDSTATAAAITVPVFALAGGEDAGCTAGEMAALGGEQHRIGDAGHYAAYEQPALVAELLAAFLARVPGRA